MKFKFFISQEFHILNLNENDLSKNKEKELSALKTSIFWLLHYI